MQVSVNGRLCVCAVGRGYEARNGQCARSSASRGNQGAVEQESNESQSNDNTSVAKGGKSGKKGKKGGSAGKRACSAPGDDLSTCACTAKHMIVSPNGKKCVCDVPNGWVAEGGRCAQKQE
jgi:hypothetical protein